MFVLITKQPMPREQRVKAEKLINDQAKAWFKAPQVIHKYYVALQKEFPTDTTVKRWQAFLDAMQGALGHSVALEWTE